MNRFLHLKNIDKVLSKTDVTLKLSKIFLKLFHYTIYPVKNWNRKSHLSVTTYFLERWNDYLFLDIYSFILKLFFLISFDHLQTLLITLINLEDFVLLQDLDLA